MRVKRIFPLVQVQGFTPVNKGISIKTLALVVSLISGGGYWRAKRYVPDRN